jgi:hypothetical protein
MVDDKKEAKQDRLIKAIRLLQHLVSKDMFGKLTLTFERGHIVNVKKETSTQW